MSSMLHRLAFQGVTFSFTFFGLRSLLYLFSYVYFFCQNILQLYASILYHSISPFTVIRPL